MLAGRAGDQVPADTTIMYEYGVDGDVVVGRARERVVGLWRWGEEADGVVLWTWPLGTGGPLLGGAVFMQRIIIMLWIRGSDGNGSRG